MDSSTYAENFQRALERTATWGMPTPRIDETWQGAQSARDLQRQATDMLSLTGETPFEMIGRCVGASIMVHDLMRARRIAEPVITIGNVAIDGVMQFNITEEGLQDELRKGFNPAQPDEHINVHVWLTFADMTCLDSTIKASHAWHTKRRRLAREEAVLVLDQKTKNSRFEFFPLLVGTGFFLRTLAPGAAGRCEDIR